MTSTPSYIERFVTDEETLFYPDGTPARSRTRTIAERSFSAAQQPTRTLPHWLQLISQFLEVVAPYQEVILAMLAFFNGGLNQ